MGIWTPGPGPTSGSDTFVGDGSNEVANGGGGGDTLNGNAGNDDLDGGAGNDHLHGGADDDTLRVRTGEVGSTETLDGGSGVDTLSLTFDTDTRIDLNTAAISSIERLQFNSTQSASTIIVAGFDAAQLGAGLSLSLVALGSDSIDIIGIAAGAGGASVDVSNWTFANWSTSDAVLFVPFSGDDTFVGSIGTDIVACDSADFDAGNAGTDNYSTGDGNDLIAMNGMTVGESIDGGSGTDVLLLQRGALVGDVYISDFSAGSITSIETLSFSAAGIVTDPNLNKLAIFSAAQIGAGLSSSLLVTGVDGFAQSVQINATGGALSLAGWTFSSWENADTVIVEGSGSADNITGTSRNDVLHGAGGNDVLNGGAGVDQLAGGAGDDDYVVDDAGDFVSEAADEGADTVQASLNWTLAANLENLTLLGSAGLQGTGNGLANTITGNSGANTLSGLDGADWLDGGAGDDTMVGGNGDDTFVVDAAGDVVSEVSAIGGTDTVRSSITYTLGSNLENLTLTGGAGLQGVGNTLNNIITGNSGANALSGLDGDDTLVGGAGADQLIGGAGFDTVSYATATGAVRVNLGAGVGLDNDAQGDTYNGIEAAIGSAFDDRFTGGTGAETFRGGAGGDTMLGQNGADLLFGDAGNDTLNGGAGTDTLNGGDDNDTLIGGDGPDQLNGGAGVDTADYSASNGGVRVNLASQLGLDFHAQGDSYSGIEIVIGSAFADRFTGSANGDTFRGGDGADVLLGQNGNDVLDGGAGADDFNGGNGDDYMIGGAGGDVLAGGTGIDIIDYSASAGGVRVNISANLGLDNDAQGDTFNSVEGVIGSAFDDRFTGATQFADFFHGGGGDDTLLGQAGDDFLYGEAGNDTITGGNNNDLLNGGLGADALNGGAGLDAFVFADALGAGNVDTITGFSVADDVIHLSTAIFGVAAGTLAASAFTIGAAAADADDRIIYNSATGALYYDADGNGVGAAVQFATLGAGLALTNADFFGFNP